MRFFWKHLRDLTARTVRNLLSGQVSFSGLLNGGEASGARGSPLPVIEDDEVTVWFANSDLCPDCSSGDFVLGPRGGLAQNMECASCGSRFNIARYEGRLLFAQRIDKVPTLGLTISVRKASSPRTLH